MLFSFGIFRAAVFAEPAVTEVEEMVGLIQGIRSQRSEVRLISDLRPLFSYCRKVPRLVFAGAARRTGTVKRLPLRTTSTCTVCPT